MKTIVITGATSGFGKSLVGKFLRNGDRVVATGRRLTERKEILREERAIFGDRLLEVDLDVTDAGERASFTELARTKLGGRIDVLVNNAGYGLFGPAESVTDEQVRAQFEVNFFGLVFLTRDLLPFVRVARGKIFNISSVLGFFGFPLTSLYCASKFAVEGFSESLAYEVGPHGVQVCLIEPGGYATGFSSGTVWAETGSDSIYARSVQRYKDLRASRTGNAANADEVPEGIFRLAQKRRLPLRQHFGKDATAAYWGKRLVPVPIFVRIMRLFFNRAIG